jgi:hypothetical protein
VPFGRHSLEVSSPISPLFRRGKDPGHADASGGRKEEVPEERDAHRGEHDTGEDRAKSLANPIADGPFQRQKNQTDARGQKKIDAGSGQLHTDR